MSDFISYLPGKRPNNVEPYFVVWCDQDGTNTGGATDDGELQGAAIATVTWTVPTGIFKSSSSTASVTIGGIVYAAGTVATIWTTGGTRGTSYSIVCKITTNDSRTLEHIIVIPVE